MVAFPLDCYTVYGANFLMSNAETYKHVREALVDLTIGIAQYRLEAGQYDIVFQCTHRAGAVMPLTRESIANILKLRAKTSGALGEEMEAMRDLRHAQRLMPEDGTIKEQLDELKRGLDPDPGEAAMMYGMMHALASMKWEDKLVF